MQTLEVNISLPINKLDMVPTKNSTQHNPRQFAQTLHMPDVSPDLFTQSTARDRTAVGDNAFSSLKQ